MSRALQELYSQFLCNNKMFSSVEEILRYRKLWPTSDMVEDMVKKVIGSVSTAKFHVGLDVSSSSTGICILSNQNNVLLCKAIHPDKSCKGNSLTSAAFLFRQIQSSILSVDPQASEHPTDWRIVVEEYLKMFGSTSFRTQGLFYLAEINGIIQFKCWEMFGSPPITLHPSTARSLLSVKSAGDRQETKKVVLQYVQNNTKDMIHWPEKKRGSGLSDDCFDMADAYILARASYVQNLIDEVNRKLVADKDNWMESPFFCEYLKANLVHFIRKYATAAEYRSFETMPKELAEKYLDRLEKNVRDVVCTLVWFFC